MKFYCVRLKKITECVPEGEIYVRAKNSGTILKCTCAECGITKTNFIKNKGN